MSKFVAKVIQNIDQTGWQEYMVFIFRDPKGA